MWIARFLFISSALIALSYGYVPASTCAQCPVNDRCLKPAEYSYPCPNGFVKNRCGCIASCQCERCPRIDTDLSCPEGRQTDANGCPTNECVPVPTCATCPVNDRCLKPAEYSYPCPNGFVKDQCGCIASCQCEGCPRINTNLSCPRGRRVDANGCPTNECVPCNICAPNDCGLRPPEFQYTCPNGNILDECGCVKSCQCEGCPRIDTSLSCPRGRRVDANGCPTNECVPCNICAPNDCGLLPVEFQYTCPNGNILDECRCVKSCQCAGCPPFNSSLSCPNGKKVDANNCPLSECNPVCEFAGDCAAVLCEVGVGVAVDENGCPLRGCPCRGSASCPAVVGCTLDCSAQGGYGSDASGCVICQCAGCPPPGLGPFCNVAGPICEFNGDCAAVTCFNEFGNAVDENGCALQGCPCQGSANCPAVAGCTLDCSARGGYKQNRDGCVICECVRPRVRPGSCPYYGVWGSVSCHSDYDCPGTLKCCSLHYDSGRKVCHRSTSSYY